MNKYLSRYFFYYPATFLKGENIRKALYLARDFQWNTPAVIGDYQLRRARLMVAWVKANSAFYRDLYKDVDPKGIESLADFSRLPTIGKSDLIDHREAILTEFSGKYETKTTGGSTGHPVQVVKNAEALAMERAVTWRAYEWAGVSIGDPQGRFWGVPHTRQGRLRAKLADLIANRKRLSAFDLNELSLGRYYGELRSFKPAYLYGYVSVIEALAHFIREQRLPPIDSINSIITTSEVLYPQSRRAIESAFGVKVYNEYGCGEVGSIAHECEHGHLHTMADNLLVEIDGAGGGGAEEGEILVTDFFNFKTPLIRYRVGDYGKLSERPCPCGRGLPVLDDVFGRAYDLLRLKNGTAIHPESLIYVVEDFKSECDAISQFQAIQRSHSEVDIFVVPKGAWSDGVASRLIERMKEKLSREINYRVQVVSAIAREKSGKMRLVKSEVAA